MPRSPLETILAPRSIAVAGASNNPATMGTIQMLNLLHSGYPGEVYPLHPKETKVFGKQAFSRAEDLPEVPDLAMLVVPTRVIPSMLEGFGRLGTRHAIIISAGFKEVGTGGEELENEILAIANQYGIRFLGPNCMGAINAHFPMNTTAAPVLTPPGGLSIASQSGTYITQTLAYLSKRGIRISKAVSVGNEASIDLVDCLEYLGQDESTRAIGLYIECIRRADRFLEAARAITRIKPIVAQYVGGTEAGARSGSSHTGAIAGPDYIYDGLFEQAGVIRVNSIGEVYAVGNALANLPRMTGKRVAVLTNSGGPGTAMANTLDNHGLEMPELHPGLQARLQEHLPGHASPRNPVDLTFHTDMTLIADTLPRILMEDDTIDGLLVHGIMDTGWGEAVFPVFGKFLGADREQIRQIFTTNVDGFAAMPWQYNKPVIVSSFFGQEDHAVSVFQEKGIPTLSSPEMAAAVMARLYQYHLIQSREPDNIATQGAPPARAAEVIAGVEGNAMDEFQAKEMLRAYDIPTCREMLAASADEAVAAAENLGFPVAVKGCSARIQHKTEKGVVFLNLHTPREVADACDAIRRRAGAIPLLVCEMLQGRREVMAGVTRFPGFPPLVLFGLGGILTEVLKDHKIRLAPFGSREARSMIRSLKTSPMLGNFRGMPPVEEAALAQILVSLGRLALDFPAIQEIDLNPIIIQNGKPLVADALFVLDTH